jgi:hypothetical protein
MSRLPARLKMALCRRAGAGAGYEHSAGAGSFSAHLEKQGAGGWSRWFLAAHFPLKKGVGSQAGATAGATWLEPIFQRSRLEPAGAVRPEPAHVFESKWYRYDD